MPGVRRVLLVVDDQPCVARSIMRFLARDFDAAHVAHDPASAEALLRSEGVTHLVCDFFLGEGVPFGTDLVPKWRAAFPGIRVAVLVSGSEMARQVDTAFIDAFFAKPADGTRLRATLATA